MTNSEFNEKTVFISGAARGFGQHIAQRFFNEGANLVLSDYNEELLADALSPFSKAPGRVVGIAGDIGLEETSRQAVQLAKDNFGRLDIAINNAGIVHELVRLHQLEGQDAEKVIQTDLMGVFFAMKHQIGLMLEKDRNPDLQCNIVNVASAAGIMGSPLLSAYSAAKHGVVGLTKTAALEYAQAGIRINAICPSFADTQMAQEAIVQSPHEDDIALKRLTASIPLKRLATIDEVVQSIFWICSPANSFYTGQALSIDGGLSA